MTVIHSTWTTTLLIALPGLPALSVLSLALLRWVTGRRTEERQVSSIINIAFAGTALASAVLA